MGIDDRPFARGSDRVFIIAEWGTGAVEECVYGGSVSFFGGDTGAGGIEEIPCGAAGASDLVKKIWSV